MKTCSKCGCTKEDSEFIKKPYGSTCKYCDRIRHEKQRIKKKVETEGYIFTTVEQYRIDMKLEKSQKMRQRQDKYGLPAGLPHKLHCSIIGQIKRNAYVFTTIEQFEKDVKVLRDTKNRYKRKFDYGTDENVTPAQQRKMFADKMTKSYICHAILGKSVSEVPDEVVETTRNILALKRELKIGSGIRK